MKFGKVAAIMGGLALGAVLVAPAAFAGRGRGGGCYGPGGWGNQDPPCAQEQYRGDSRGWRGGYRGDCSGPGDCAGYENRGRFQRRGGGGRWDCRGPQDCPGPRNCWGPQDEAPAPEQGAPAPEAR